ncbi:response regulator [Paraburkholderia xenovorans]
MSELTTILLVDDDRSILKAWTRVLQLAGYSVATACDGATAMAVAQQIQPGLIVTDRSMPGMNGIELCYRVRREPKLANTPLVLATAKPETVIGAPVWDDLWLKPVSVETMCESIQRLLTLDAGY